MAKSGRADAVLIGALAAGATQEAAAKQAGVGTRTVRDRLADPTCKTRVEAARAELVQTATARLSAAAGQAVETLVGLLAAESESVRLGGPRASLNLVASYGKPASWRPSSERLRSA